MSEKEKKGRAFHPRILSGIQPTGDLHLGNYLGAVKNWVALQETDKECFYCVVDYHAITADHDAAALPERTLEMARDLMACGVDPDRSTLFIQSQIPEHLELAWIFAAVTAYGDLSRMTQFKDKSDRAEFISAALFTYPILQAADILAYQATGVPVGEDQVQHLELCRGIARRFNNRYGELFPETEPILTEGARIMSHADPTSKMSKSLGEGHYIGIFEDEKSLRKKIMRHVTATGGEAVDETELAPGLVNLLTILQNTAPADVYESLKQRVESGEKCYGDLKKAVADHLMETLKPLRDRRNALSTHDVHDVVTAGAKVAREQAARVVAEARQRIGIIEL